jgi:hypothetical protein
LVALIAGIGRFTQAIAVDAVKPVQLKKDVRLGFRWTISEANFSPTVINSRRAEQIVPIAGFEEAMEHAFQMFQIRDCFQPLPHPPCHSPLPRLAQIQDILSHLLLAARAFSEASNGLDMRISCE